MKVCCKSFILEFHYSKLCLFHHNWKAFTYTPWLPYKWTFQIPYLVYRWFLALYFLSWLIVAGVQSGGPRYFIFLTNWAFIIYNLHLIVAALSTTVKYLSVHFLCPVEDDSFSRANDYSVKKPQGCCGSKDNSLSWYQMIHWLLFILATDLAVGVMILYWALLYRGGSVSGVNANTHLVNGLVALIDLWISGLPVNILHMLYPLIFGLVYSIFSGVYFAISGDIIYSVLDYENSLGLAVGAVVGVVFVLLPLLHLVVFLQHFAKFWIFYFVFGRKERLRTGHHEEGRCLTSYSRRIDN